MHLEFQYLSQLSGKEIYLQKVEKIRKTVKEASENNMYFNYINQQTGKWCQSAWPSCQSDQYTFRLSNCRTSVPRWTRR